MNADGTGQKALTASGSANNLNPCFSPDGARIIFSSNQIIYIINADGSNPYTGSQFSPKLLYAGNCDSPSPVFSPDGTKIAYVFNDITSGSDLIYTMNASGTGPTPLITDPNNHSLPVFSPDGTKIAYQSNNQIYITGRTQPLATGTYPCFSPDGLKIAYTVYSSGRFNIYTVSSDGSGTPTQLTNDTNISQQPSWSR
jgi:Tol biopolymer transport system component